MIAVAAVLAFISLAFASLFFWQRRKAAELDRAIRSTRAEAGALLTLSKSLEISTSYLEILKAVETAIESIIGFKSAWMFLADNDPPTELRLLTIAGAQEDNIIQNAPTLPAKGDAMIEEILSSRHPVVVEDARTDPRTTKEFVKKMGNRTIINVPLLTADRLLGALGTGSFWDEGTRRLTRAEIDFIDAVGSRTAVALDRLRQYQIRLEEHDARLKLAKAIEYAGDGILVGNARQIITYVNPAWERIMGGSHGSVVGQPISAQPCFARDEGALAQITAAASRGEEWNGKLALKRGDGKEIVLTATVSPVGATGGAEGGYVAVVRDITSEEELNRAKDYFVHITAHEMRTPLTKLRFCKYLIDETTRQTERHQEELTQCNVVLAEVYGNLQRIAETTGVLTELASSGAATAPPTKVFPLLAACADKARGEMANEGRRIELRSEINLAQDAMAAIAPEHLDKAMMELLSNAVKYTPDGGTVQLLAGLNDKNVIVKVMSQGEPLTANELASLFTPFYSSETIEHHSSGRYKYMGGGLGLGLSVVKMIMDHYGGSVWMENLPGGKGGVTTIEFPRLTEFNHR